MNNGGPAFPTHGSMGEVATQGATLRDYFAAHAATGLLAHNCAHFKDADLEASGIADRAYQIADAMLKTREKAT